MSDPHPPQRAPVEKRQAQGTRSPQRRATTRGRSLHLRMNFQARRSSRYHRCAQPMRRHSHDAQRLSSQTCSWMESTSRLPATSSGLERSHHDLQQHWRLRLSRLVSKPKCSSQHGGRYWDPREDPFAQRSSRRKSASAGSIYHGTFPRRVRPISNASSISSG